MSGVFCESKPNRHKSTCTWTIHDWELTGTWTPDMKLTSEIFSSVTNNGTKWCLEIFPMGKIERVWRGDRSGSWVEQNFVSVYLCLVSVKEGSVAQANFVLYGLNEKNEKVMLVTINYQPFDINAGLSVGVDNGLCRKHLSDASKYGVVLDDKLRLVCEVSEWDISYNLVTPKIIVPECRLADDYNILFKTKALSDVKIIAKGNIEFQAHKLILATRSPVFAAMFKHQMREQSNNCVEITNTEPKVLEEMLRFIYTGKIGVIDATILVDLLMVADKYDLQRLKIMCEEKLCATLSINTAAHIFMIADRCNCEQLKRLTTNFVSQHGKDVIRTRGYSSIIESHPLVADMILRGIFS